jgi:lysophospholipase L1-like esterase
MSDLTVIARDRAWLFIAPLAVIVVVLATLAMRRPAIPAGAAIQPAGQHVDPSALFLGDSYTAGTGATGVTTGEACLTANALGWVCNLDAQGGTGFVTGAPSSAGFGALPTRLTATHSAKLADIIIIDAGRNDGDQDPAKVQTAIRNYLHAVRQAWPLAKLVVVEPYYMGQAASPLSPATLAVLRAQTKRAGGVLVDPIGEGWIKRSLTAKMTIKDGIHPTPAGHRYIARHLVADLRRLGLDTVAVTDRRGAAARAG